MNEDSSSKSRLAQYIYLRTHEKSTGCRVLITPKTIAVADRSPDRSTVLTGPSENQAIDRQSADRFFWGALLHNYPNCYCHDRIRSLLARCC